jgi:hypothetical protein
MDLQGASARLQDVPADQLEAALSQPGEAKKLLDKSVSAGFVGLGVAQLIGIASGGLAGAASMFLLAAQSDRVPAQSLGGVILVPRQEAGDDPRELVVRTLRDAAIAALGAEGAEWIQAGDRYADQIAAYFRLTGGECAERDCQLFIPIAQEKRSGFFVEQTLPAYLDPARGTALRIKLWHKNAAVLKIDKRLATLEQYGEFSRRLPDWVYLYYPPTPTLTPVPILLNRGQVMLFVKSEPKAGESKQD